MTVPKEVGPLARTEEVGTYIVPEDIGIASVPERSHLTHTVRKAVGPLLA